MRNEDVLRKDVRRIQLNILKKLDEVCEHNELKYYLAFGTCLGALRHKGFIPWDDDIDVLMPYDDAKKLIQLQEQFGSRYFIQSKETDPDYRSIAMRIRDCETTCIESDEVALNIKKGIYVDIYPYYECSSNKLLRKLDIVYAHLMKILVNNRPPVNHGKIIAVVSKMVLNSYSEKRRINTIKKIERHLCNVKGDEILDYYGQDISLLNAITYPKEWFGEPQKLEFEGLYFNGATQPEKYMKKRYGDYMKMPPISEQVVHHTYVAIDPYKSYIEYENDIMMRGKNGL